MKIFFLIFIPFSCFCTPFLLPITKNSNINRDERNNLQIKSQSKNSKCLSELNTLDESRKFPCDSFIKNAKKELCKINKGSDCCIVSFSSYSKQYTEFTLSNIFQLKKSGFDGYYLYFLGEYPSLSGEELQYVGVPYVFKISALLEAKKLGFNKILWLDTSMQPLRNPEPLFEIIDKQGVFFTTAISLFPGWEEQNPQEKILPHMRDHLLELTNIDAACSKYYVPATIFGFKMDHPLTILFLDKYYELIRDAYGLISEAPEEYVHSCILSQDIFNEWDPTVTLKLLYNKRKRKLTQIRKKRFFKTTKKVSKRIDEEKKICDQSAKEGYFFYYRAH